MILLHDQFTTWVEDEQSLGVGGMMVIKTLNQNGQV